MWQSRNPENLFARLPFALWNIAKIQSPLRFPFFPFEQFSTAVRITYSIILLTLTTLHSIMLRVYVAPSRRLTLFPIWLSPFFSQRSILPLPYPLSFHNHLDCLCSISKIRPPSPFPAPNSFICHSYKFNRGVPKLFPTWNSPEVHTPLDRAARCRTAHFLHFRLPRPS